jgi:integrase
MDDRDAGMRVLAATTGMRRSELAGAERTLLDLDNATLELGDTRIVVDGKAEDSDRKSESGQRTISLDPLTVGYLRQHLAMLDEEHRAFGTAYQNHGKLMCHPDGTPVHPDTITRRFNKLVDRAGVLESVSTTSGTPTPPSPSMPASTPKSSATASATPTWPIPCRSTRTPRPAATRPLP